MGKITLDPSISSQFEGLQEPTEVAGGSGKSIGAFLPAEQYQKILYQLAESQCPYSPEELARMQAETGGKSLKDIWTALGQS